MANNCHYTMKICGTKENVDNYQDFINDNGDIEIGGFEDWKWVI